MTLAFVLLQWDWKEGLVAQLFTGPGTRQDSLKNAGFSLKLAAVIWLQAST